MCRQVPHQKRHFWKTKRQNNEDQKWNIQTVSEHITLMKLPSSSVTSPQAELCSELQWRIMCLVSEILSSEENEMQMQKRRVRSELRGFFSEAGSLINTLIHTIDRSYHKHQHQICLCVLLNKAACCASKIVLQSSSVANPFNLLNSETVDINNCFLSTRLGKSVHQCPRLSIFGDEPPTLSIRRGSVASDPPKM